MAATVTVGFSGGPCNGKVQKLPLAQVEGGKLKCGGVEYAHDPNSKPWPPEVGGPIIRFVPASDVSGGGGGGGGSTAPTHVSEAWTRWMRALGHKGPAAHNRIVKSTARARRIARKH